MARKYYRNNELKEEDKRKEYFGLSELKLQKKFLFFSNVSSFFFVELGARHKIRTKNKEHKRNKIG